MSTAADAVTGLGVELRAGDHDEYLAVVGDALIVLFPGEHIAWHEIDLGTQALRVWADRSWDADLARALGAVAGDHPLLQHYLAGSGEWSPRRLSDVVGLAHLRSTVAYGELLAPLGAIHQLAIPTSPVSDGSTTGWAISRSGGDFSERDTKLAAAVQPVLAMLEKLLRAETPPPERSGVAGYRYGLTPRELQVLELVAAGLTAQAVGRALGISGRTVRKHLENCYAKLGCHDRLIAVDRIRTACLLDS